MATSSSIARLPRLPRLPRYTLLPAILLSLASLASGACVIDLGGGDDEPCGFAENGGGAPAADIAGTLLIDPETLTCTEFGFGGCGTCGPCPEPLPPIPSWGACQSQCTGLGELACVEAAGCRTAYDHNCLLGEGPCTAFQPFLGCFAIDASGPAGGACDQLGAFECSRHDDCLATYRDSGLCSNGRDDDGDGLVDEGDECRSFGVCLTEVTPRG